MENVLTWSRFNFLIDIDNSKYLYNSYTNGIIQLDDSLFQQLEKISSSKKLFNYNTESLFSDEEIDYLKDNYILVKDDNELVDIMHHQSLARLYSKKHLVITIAPTQSCNFNCSYCFEKWRNSPAISNKTEDAIVNYICEQKEKEGLDSISLTWYGGEPLLQYKRILSLGKRINELGLKFYENLLITNGYYFTLDVIKELVDINIEGVQITLDGAKEIHDTRRPLNNGKGTFDAIIKNLDNYFNSSYQDSMLIAIRVNIDTRNYDCFIDLYRWLHNRYKSKKLIVYPGIIVLDEENENCSTCLNRDSTTDIFLNLYKNHNIKIESLIPDDINIECMTRSPYSMLIGSKGEIYKCYEDLGNENLVVGNINDKEIWNNHELISKYSVGIDHYQDPECRKCSYLPICHGGCPIRRLENKYKKKKNDCCTPFKGRIKDYLQLYLNK